MLETASHYERRYAVRFIDKLGDGKDGFVFETAERMAVKFLNDQGLYHRELRAYQILLSRNIDSINGFQIPRLIRSDDELRAIEMTVVRPPFVLDFASTYTSNEYERFGFTAEVLEERELHWAEVFGDHWATVQLLCEAFTRETGLLLLDLSLNNIKFGPK